MKKWVIGSMTFPRGDVTTVIPMAIDTLSIDLFTQLTYVVPFVMRFTIYQWAKEFVRIIQEARGFMEQQVVDQKQEVVVREETLGLGKAVICNLNYYHQEETMPEERMQEEKISVDRTW
jgi:hypothetical protein